MAQDTIAFEAYKIAEVRSSDKDLVANVYIHKDDGVWRMRYVHTNHGLNASGRLHASIFEFAVQEALDEARNINLGKEESTFVAVEPVKATSKEVYPYS